MKWYPGFSKVLLVRIDRGVPKILRRNRMARLVAVRIINIVLMLAAMFSGPDEIFKKLMRPSGLGGSAGIAMFVEPSTRLLRRVNRQLSTSIVRFAADTCCRCR